MLDNERCLSKKTSICSEAIIICTDISIVLCTKDSALKTFKISAILLNCRWIKNHFTNPIRTKFELIWTWLVHHWTLAIPANLEPFHWAKKPGLSTKIEPERFKSSEVGFDTKFIYKIDFLNFFLHFHYLLPFLGHCV